MNAKFNLDNLKIWIPGSNGMVASALIRRLKQENVSILATNRQDLDLTDLNKVNDFYQTHAPDVVFLAAAKVGGIHANQKYPADFIATNLKIQQNLIDCAKLHNVKKLIFLGSSCIYPKECSQPIKETQLLTGPLEPTNQWYAIAKIAGIKMCQAYREQFGCDFISVMPTNLYGQNDNFHPQNSHVAAALLARFHHAQKTNATHVTVGGTGKPLREFLHIDDLADACVFILKHYSDKQTINIGTGSDISIKEFAQMIKKITNYQGEIEFDTTYPDGTYRKKLDVSKLNQLGWHHKIDLLQGFKSYYNWYLQNEVTNE